MGGPVTAESIDARLAALFIAQVRKIDDGLADICQRHLDQGYSLNTVMQMLKDAQRIAAAARRAPMTPPDTLPTLLESASGAARKLRVLSLFAGIGGFDLGLERTGGFETVAFCEIDPFCQRVLAKHWPEVPCYDDVLGLTAKRLAADGISVDVICGGFPCQPFSSASRGRRVAVDLWPEMLRLIVEIRPRYVVAENVIHAAVDRASREIQEVGYASSVEHISAARAGADHIRDRWWLCAYADHESELPRALDAKMAELPGLCRGLWGSENYARAIRVPDGLPDRTHRLKALGNAVVPQIPELIGRAILAAASTPALALCSASLRAREAGDPA